MKRMSILKTIGVYPETHEKILKIVKSKGMMNTTLIKFLIDAEYDKIFKREA